jgi:hypothetical protein
MTVPVASLVRVRARRRRRRPRFSKPHGQWPYWAFLACLNAILAVVQLLGRDRSSVIVVVPFDVAIASLFARLAVAAWQWERWERDNNLYRPPPRSAVLYTLTVAGVYGLLVVHWISEAAR